MKHFLGCALISLCMTMLVVAASAQTTVRVRAIIEKVDGNTLTVKTREGAEAVIKLAPDARISGVVKTSLDEAKPGTFVGVAAVPGSGGDLRALEVLVFPESMRGTGEGHREWDL